MLSDDLKLEVDIALAHLQNLRSGVPTGVPDQLNELVAILAAYDASRSSSDVDPKLSPNGKCAAAEFAANSARADINKWRTTRVNGLDNQLASLQSALLTKAGEQITEPSPLRLQTTIDRLSNIDPVELQTLYFGASPDEQRLLEAAARAIGTQPVRRGDQWRWETLLPQDVIASTVLARAETVDAAGASQLRDLQRIRNTFDGMAGSATALVNQSLPRSVAVA